MATPAPSANSGTSPVQPAAVAPGWYPEPTTGHSRWWDGSAWGPYPNGPGQPAVARNGFAIAALILGIWGILTTWIPLFLGLFLGAVPDILAIVFGIIGIVRARRAAGAGLPLAVTGLVLGSVAFLSIFFGAGTIW